MVSFFAKVKISNFRPKTMDSFSTHRVHYNTYIMLCITVAQSNELKGPNVSGHLCIKKPWPGMARTIYGNHDAFMQVYYHPHPGMYHIHVMATH